MTTFLAISDGLQRTLGFLEDDEALDDQAKALMTAKLTAAELYVQSAIGEDDDFYQDKAVKQLYTLACNAVAANWYNHPTSAPSSTTARQIISQLRGAYDAKKVGDSDGATAEQ